MSRKTAISPHHPAISTRRRGRVAGQFHTRSKHQATMRGECDCLLLCSGPARHAHALVSQGHARTAVRARVRTSRARAAAAASTRQLVLGHQPVRQQNNTKGSCTLAPQTQMGSPPAADTRPDVIQQTWTVRGAGAALPRCLGPRRPTEDKLNWLKIGTRRAARRRVPAHALWCCAQGRWASACDARLVRAARGVQRAQQGAARALFPILSPILFPIFGRALSREFSGQK
jgi:hypothetical protein